MNRAEVLDLFADMLDYWPHHKLGRDRADGWAKVLEDVPYDVVTESLPALARDFPDFPPTPGRIWRLVCVDPDAPREPALPDLSGNTNGGRLNPEIRVSPTWEEWKARLAQGELVGVAS